MFKIAIGSYIMGLKEDTPPSLYDRYCQHATLVDKFDLERTSGGYFYVSVSHGTNWPHLVVAQRYSPHEAGFEPGVLLIPETKSLFIGAGERLIAYRLDTPARLWEDKPDAGFWHWSQHDEVILMAAELELAAWDWHGRKLWTTFVEPPWDYRVVGGQLFLDVMGRKSEFALAKGPATV